MDLRNLSRISTGFLSLSYPLALIIVISTVILMSQENGSDMIITTDSLGDLLLQLEIFLLIILLLGK